MIYWPAVEVSLAAAAAVLTATALIYLLALYRRRGKL